MKNMQDKQLHIVAFAIPFPANYGGVIDVFYKLKALHAQGIQIHLHCFEYMGRERAEELKQYCKTVHYYQRKTGLQSAFSIKPYIVQSRKSEELVQNLLQDDFPILYEGLHSCYSIDDPRLRKRHKIYRESNIEHHYYFNLFRVDPNLRNKLFFLTESMKLRLYQNILQHANLMLVVSQKDAAYLKKQFPQKQVIYLPSFHKNEVLKVQAGHGKYALYHGNLEVPENAHAVAFLIREVFNDLPIPLKVAGMNPSDKLRQMAAAHAHIQITANPSDADMFNLIEEAHVHVLVTFQATGLKLKLLNTLYNGRFCLVNHNMLNGTGLNDLCAVADTPAELKKQIKALFEENFSTTCLKQRQEVLNKLYSNEQNAKQLIQVVFHRNNAAIFTS